MIQFSNIEIRRGQNRLLHSVNCQIYQSNRVGVIGRNGCGKSSLFALINGEIEADQGDLSIPAGCVIASVRQQIDEVETPAMDYVLAGDSELLDIESQIKDATELREDNLLGELYARLEAIDGYNARVRAAQLLQGLGFEVESHHASVGSFSGGWRMRLNLAQALMCRSDLLLLDEPTNHLDLDAVLWLEEWLAAYTGTVLLISHDRDFLDRTVDHVLHIENGTAQYYTGNYSDFEKQRAEHLAQQQSAFEKQQREIKHMQHFIDRFKAKASKAKQAQSRVKALEKLELIGPAHIDSPFSFHFETPKKVPNPLITLEQVSAGYDNKTVLSAVDFCLVPGSRIGVLGHNGAGKSTMMKLLAADLQASEGEVTRSAGLAVGYFAQHQLELLDYQADALIHMQRLDTKATEQSLLNYLGSFGFSGDDCKKQVGVFSGGEKSRLVLAMVVYQKPNLLILDEPTNHLDIDMRTALVTALQDFEGAIIIVSHDSYMLNAVCDQFYRVASGRVAEFDGDLDDYWKVLKSDIAEQAMSAASNENVTETVNNRKLQRQQKAENRRKLQPMKNRLQKLDQQLDKLHTEKAGFETQLADQSLYTDENKARLSELLIQQAATEKSLAETEDEWMQLSEQLDNLQQESAQ